MKALSLLLFAMPFCSLEAAVEFAVDPKPRTNLRYMESTDQIWFYMQTYAQRTLLTEWVTAAAKMKMNIDGQPLGFGIKAEGFRTCIVNLDDYVNHPPAGTYYVNFGHYAWAKREWTITLPWVQWSPSNTDISVEYVKEVIVCK
jgi:hypothetical protein